MYDWIDTWQQAWRAPSAVLGAFARGLDDRNTLPPWLALPKALGFDPPALTIRRATSASFSVLRRLTEPREKPAFGIVEVDVDGTAHAVREEVVEERPFCRLLRFDLIGRSDAPTILLVAPMAGHYATLLRETVRDLLPSYSVVVTDWSNARDVPIHDGGFDLDDYIDLLSGIFKSLDRPRTSLLSARQAYPPSPRQQS
jgi:poly(3-hydroxybutyrate) depolymerase